jgi:hypothetical protein
MGQLLVPALIGAGVGAVGGAATGKNPFKAALLGGALGAGGAGLMGVGGAAGATGAATEGVLSSAAPVLGDAAFISPFTPTGVAGIQTANASLSGLSPILGQAGEQAIAQGANMYKGSQGMFDLAKGSTLGYDPSFLGGQGPATFAGGGGYDPSFLGRINESIGNIGNPFSDLTTSDKLGLGLKGFDLMNQPQQMIQPVQVAPITRGNPEAVSAPLFNVAPNVGMQQGNEIGLPNLKTTIPLTDEEILRLQQMLQTTGFRGR